MRIQCHQPDHQIFSAVVELRRVFVQMSYRFFGALRNDVESLGTGQLFYLGHPDLLDRSQEHALELSQHRPKKKDVEFWHR